MVAIVRITFGSDVKFVVKLLREIRHDPISSVVLVYCDCGDWRKISSHVAHASSKMPASNLRIAMVPCQFSRVPAT